MILETFSAYACDEDGCLMPRNREVSLANDLDIRTIEDAESHAFDVTGLQLGDIALYAYAIDPSGVSEVPFFVTNHDGKETATLVADPLVRAHPERYATLYFARTLQKLQLQELAQMYDDPDDLVQLAGIFTHIDARFPRSQSS